MTEEQARAVVSKLTTDEKLLLLDLLEALNETGKKKTAPVL